MLPRDRPSVAGILHLGLGNFHRAHQAVYTARALDAVPGPWGIVGVTHRSRFVVDALAAQGGRYSVITLDADGPRVDVLDIHVDTLVMAEEPERVVELVAHPDIRVVTLTITEKGYQRRGDRQRPAGTAKDGPDGPPWVLDLLARGLAARCRDGRRPISVVSCDNLLGNGRVLRGAVTEILEREGDEDVLAWLRDSVGFPCTMVDRIVPATEPRHVDLARDLTGLHDAVPVPAEPFTMWVMEDDFPGGRPAWDKVGVTFVGDVLPYELLKLRLVNTTNSLLAYLGLLLGEELIADTLTRHPRVAAVATQLILHEMLPTFEPPHGLDVDRYVDELFARFSNVEVGHRTAQVGSDGSVKLPIRIVDPVLHHHDRGAVPGGLALLAASFVRVFSDARCTGVSERAALEDPWAEDLRQLGAADLSSRDLVRAVLTAGPFGSGLAQAGPWLATVGDLHELLVERGVAAGIERALSLPSRPGA